jgi:type III pantothenate kinase
MLLALDVGNTNITAGAFEGGRLREQWRHPTAPRSSAPALGRALAASALRHCVRVEACVIGSVVPELDGALRRAVEFRFGVQPVLVTPQSDLGIALRVKKPRQVGADRILNALAAHDRSGGRPAVVLDFGTATTFDCVAANGDYLGGAILPGPNLAARALHDHTAKLPLVPVAKPARAVGRDTVECIQAGVFWGYLGMIEKVLERTLSELGGRPKLYATGGLSRLFAADLPKAMEVVPDLTLDGLRIAYERLSA